VQTKSLIFAFTAVLLVPFFYASFSMSDACAAIRDPKFGLGDCKYDPTKSAKTCCWYQKSYPGEFGRGDKYCQTCTYYHDSKGEPYEKCTDPKKQTIQLPPGSNLPQDLPQLKSTDNNTNNSNGNTSLDSKLIQKGGDLQLETNDNTTLKDDTRSSKTGNSQEK
jgi:hypothetical protein